ncbi:MAG: hypothetical protein WD097_06950 [Balneolales bacterium]
MKATLVFRNLLMAVLFLPLIVAGEKSADEKTVVLYSFDDRDRQEWIGSNHFEGFMISSDWSSMGRYSLKGILAQQSPADWEPELCKFFRPDGESFSRYNAISVDVRHQSGNCDPGNGLQARIYLTDTYDNRIGQSQPVRISDQKSVVTMYLPDDLEEGIDPSRLNAVGRLSVQFLPCASSTGNIDVYIDNVTAQLAD